MTPENGSQLPPAGANRPPRRRGPSGLNPEVAIGYARISKADEGSSSIEGQEADMHRWCSQHGVRLARIERDVNVSGGKAGDDRDGLQRALIALRTERAGILLVAKRDRLARDLLQASLLEQKVMLLGARIASADGIGAGDQPMDVFQWQILDSVAELERAMIRGRTKRALAVKRGKGERISGVAPYGYRFDQSRVIEDPEEQPIVVRICELRAAGWTYNAIATVLNNENVAARGAKWYPATVRSVCLRPSRP